MSFICKNARLWKRIRLAWTIICHLRIEKEKIYPFWEHFNQTLNKYIPAEHKIRKKLWRLFAERKASIFTPKSEKFLWRIWKIKLLASSLNLCLLNQLGHVTTMEATKMNEKPSLIDWVLKNGATVKTTKRCQPD